MSSLFIVIPAYNESENIEQTIRDWYPIVESNNKEGKSRLVIINDGSKDNTLQLVKAQMKDHPLLIALDKPNGGHGSTVLYGYRYAIKNHADYIFQTDSDGQTNPAEFEQFWKKRNSFDAIIGNREVRGDGKSRKFVENTVCFLLRMIFHVKVRMPTPLPPDAHRPGKQIHLPTPEKLQPPQHHAHHLLRILQRKSNLPPHHLQTQTSRNQLHQPEKITKIGWQAIKDFHTLKKSM